MKKNPSTSRKSAAADEWDKQWQQHWRTIDTPGYELLVGGPGGEDREFLAAAGTPPKVRSLPSAMKTSLQPLTGIVG